LIDFREKSKPRTGRLPKKEKLNPGLARRKSPSRERGLASNLKKENFRVRRRSQIRVREGNDPATGEMHIADPEEEFDSSLAVKDGADRFGYRTKQGIKQLKNRGVKPES
jgi:hypothetical protein